MPEARPPAPDLDAEQEVDFGRYWSMIAARWWLPVGLLVAGLVIGYLVSLGTNSTTYRATAQVYLGQPLAPDSGAPVSSAPTNLGLVSNFAGAESTIRRVASQVGLRPSRLRGHVTTKPILGITNAKLGTPAPLLAITVTGSPPAKVAAAANALADAVVAKVSTYTGTKIQALEDQLSFDESQLKDVDRRITDTNRQQQVILASQGLGASEKLIASVNFNNVLIFLENRRASLERDRLDVRQLLSLAREVESARIIASASATTVSGTNARTGAAIGGLIGLIVGILAALLWDPIAARSRAHTG